jgi:hypothetical protein
MRQPRAFDVFLEKTPAAQALALEIVTGMDLLRLEVIARLHARGLPPEIDWSDLLQEAISRVLEGSRPKPQGVGAAAFFGVTVLARFRPLPGTTIRRRRPQVARRRQPKDDAPPST